MRILFIGDIVGKPGRKAVSQFLPEIKAKGSVDFVIANGENAAGGKGITPEKYEEIIQMGVDCITSGNHIWRQSDIIPVLQNPKAKLLRPANYPSANPGRGELTFTVKGEKITVINLLGRTYIPSNLDNPFVIGKEIVHEHKNSIIVIDFHAEATSEKAALAHYLDGSVSAIIGTHTHVQTADERILKKGTAFISDAGMSGAQDSVLGVTKEQIIAEFLTGLPQSHKVAIGEIIFNAVLVEIDSVSKKAISIKRIFEKE